MRALPHCISLLPWDALQGPPGLSVVPGMGAMDGAWYCCPRSRSAPPLLGNVWSGTGQRHAARVVPVLPSEMGDLRPGENEAMESLSKLPFLTFLGAQGAACTFLVS